MFQYRNFIKSFCGLAGTYLFLVFLINFIVDPYGIRKGGGRVTNDRLVKAIKVSEIQPKTVLLGSSGVARGLDPEHDALSDDGPVYNLSILGANIYELKRYFDHAQSISDLETVVIGLDFYAFNHARETRTGFSESRLGSRFLMPGDFFGLYLSLDSLGLILNPDKRGLYFAQDGTYEHPIGIEIERQFEIKLAEDFTKSEQMYWDYNFSEETIEHFASLVDNARDEETAVKAFLPPLHATLFYSAMVDNYWETYENWVREIVKIHPVWDFSGCNSITAESIGENMEYYEDPSHYTYVVGDLILNKIFDKGQPDNRSEPFGVYITPDNVDEHLQRISNQCQQWANSNPQVVQWLKNLDLVKHHAKLSKVQ